MRTLLLLYLIMSLFAVVKAADDIRFSESFDDDQIDQRGWYDGKEVRIVPGGVRGTCIEYEWKDGGGTVTGSSAKRHLFEATDEVFIRISRTS